MNTIITRANAHASGMTHYYTGKPCSAGHVATRYVSTGNCAQCQKERSKSFASTLRKGHVAAIRGHFSYPLHADDHAAALAYCQALDMDRGFKPRMPEAAPNPGEITSEQIAAIRLRVMGENANIGVQHIPTLK